MRILIAGAGAMGSRFGYLLKESGNEVILADTWRDHVDAINKDGLKRIIDGKDIGNIDIPAMFPSEVRGHFDLIIVFTKAMKLNHMMESLHSVIHDDTRVLCLLNGLGNLEVIEKYIPKEQIYIGVTVWTSGLAGPGVLDAVGTGSIEVQQVNKNTDSFNNVLLNTLNRAGLNAHLSDNVMQSIWHKVSLNCVLNTYCTLIDCYIGEYGQYESNQLLTDMVLNEIIAVAHEEGIEVIYETVKNNIINVFPPDKAGNHHPSLYQDIANGRKTEIDHLNGAISRLGKKHNIQTPVCDVITLMIHAKESVNDQRKEKTSKV